MNNIHIRGSLGASDLVCNLYLSLGFAKGVGPRIPSIALWRHASILDGIDWFSVEIQI